LPAPFSWPRSDPEPNFTIGGQTITVRIPISIRRRGGRKLVLAPTATEMG
jgi:hypothetical protein